MSEFSKGDDNRYGDAEFISYGINHGKHGNAIEVHGDEALRDRILALLTAPAERGDEYDRGYDARIAREACGDCATMSIGPPVREVCGDEVHWHHYIDPGDGLAHKCPMADVWEDVYQQGSKDRGTGRGDEVERAREAFYKASRAWYAHRAEDQGKESAFTRHHYEKMRVAYDDLLAAESARRGGKGGGA